MILIRKISQIEHLNRLVKERGYGPFLISLLTFLLLLTNITAASARQSLQSPAITVATTAGSKSNQTAGKTTLPPPKTSPAQKKHIVQTPTKIANPQTTKSTVAQPGKSPAPTQTKDAPANTAPNATKTSNPDSINNGSTVIVLKNGLRLILVNQPSYPIVSCQLWIHRGLKEEGNEKGVLYALKHTLNLQPLMENKELSMRLLGHAAQFDSFVSEDFTTFVINAAADDLKDCLAVQAGRFNTDLLNPQMVIDGIFEANKKLASTKISEYQKLENEVKALISSNNKTEGKSHKVANAKRIKDYFDSSFKSAPVTLVIAGRFDTGAVLKQVQESFTKTKSAVTPVNADQDLTIEDGEKSFTRFVSGDTNRILIIFKTPGISNADIAPLVVLESLLTNKVNGILKNRFQANSLCTKTDARLELKRGQGLFKVYFMSQRGLSPETVMSDFDSLAQFLKEVSVDPLSLERAKKRAYMRFLKRQAGPYEAAYQHGFFDCLDNHKLMQNWGELISKVEDKDIQRVASKYLVTGNRSVGILKTKSNNHSTAEAPQIYESLKLSTSVPVKSNPTANLTPGPAKTSTQKPQSTQTTTNKVSPPAPANPAPKQSTTLVGRELANGIKLVLLPIPGCGLVSISGALQSGYAFEPTGKKGVCEINTALMNGDSIKITEKKSKDLETKKGLSEEDLINFSSDYLHTRIHASCIKDNLQTILKLISHHLRYPDMSDKKLEDAKDDTAKILIEKNDLVASKLKEHLVRNLLEKNSPYNPRQLNQQISSLSSISPKDVKEFRDQTIKPSSMILVAAGDIDIGTLTEQLNTVFADWQGESNLPIPTAQKKKRQILKVVLPGSPQTANPQLVAGRLLDSPIDKSAVNLSLLKAALIKHPINAMMPKYKYGNSINLTSEMLGDNTLFLAQIDAKRNLLEDTFKAFKLAVQKLSEEGIGESEFADLKIYLAKDSLLTNSNNLFNLSNSILNRIIEKRPLDSFREINAKTRDEFAKFVEQDLKIDQACLVIELNKESKNLSRKLNMQK